MKVAVLGHNQVTLYNRSRWLRLAELYPETQVTVLPPRRWKNRSYGKLVHFQVEPEERGNYCVHPIDVYPPGSFRFVYLSHDLGFRRIKPDVIWVYMDPLGPMLQQALLYRKLHAPKAKIVCCTSRNTPTPLHRFDLRWRYDFALRRVDAFSTGTQEVIERLRSEGITCPILHRVITGADERHWHPGEELELKKELGLEDLVVGFVGRHEFAKGLPDLIAALEGLEGEWGFLSLGEGPFKDEAEKHLQAVRGEKGVCLCGYVPHEQTPPYYRCMDVLVLASRRVGIQREPAGVVIMEANLCGVVAIGSDLPGPAEMVGETGFVIPEGDIQKLRACLKYLRDDPIIRKQLAQKARERALEMFATSAVARDTFAFFKQITSQDT